MIRAVVRRGDGLPGERVWLHSVVGSVQRALVDSGHLKVDSDIARTADGRFGAATEKAVKAFQADKNLEPTGIVSKPGWARLEPHLRADVQQREERIASLLKGFHGDLDWIHAHEGHKGRPYWPGGQSGVTLDPGVDVGHAAPALIEQIYAPFLSPQQRIALREMFGIQGDAAAAALRGSAALAGIRISNAQAAEIMPFAAKDYWSRVCARFRKLSAKTTPPSVQTALLSLAYNRGPENAHLESLGELLAVGDWREAATKISSMQQRHKLRGIRIRRRQEGSLIQAEIDYLDS